MPDVDMSAKVVDEAGEGSEVADPEAEQGIEAHLNQGGGEHSEAEGEEEKSASEADAIEVPGDIQEDQQSTEQPPQIVIQAVPAVSQAIHLHDSLITTTIPTKVCEP